MMWRAWMLLALLAGCASQPVTVDVAASRRIAIDSQRTTALAPGVSHRVLYAGAGPWVIQVLEATLDTCTTLRAIKGTDGAVGRERTSVMLTRLNDSITVLGGVNADFFLFTPPGVPTNAYITRRRVVTGPSAQPVFAIDPAGHPQIGTLGIRGEAVTASGALLLSGWNRAAPSGLAVFDRTWGNQLDSATAVIEVVLSGDAARRVVLVDTLPAGALLPRAAWRWWPGGTPRPRCAPPSARWPPATGSMWRCGCRPSIRRRRWAVDRCCWKRASRPWPRSTPRPSRAPVIRAPPSGSGAGECR